MDDQESASKQAAKWMTKFRKELKSKSISQDILYSFAGISWLYQGDTLSGKAREKVEALLSVEYPEAFELLKGAVEHEKREIRKDNEKSQIAAALFMLQEYDKGLIEEVKKELADSGIGSWENFKKQHPNTQFPYLYYFWVNIYSKATGQP